MQVIKVKFEKKKLPEFLTLQLFFVPVVLQQCRWVTIRCPTMQSHSVANHHFIQLVKLVGESLQISQA